MRNLNLIIIAALLTFTGCSQKPDTQTAFGVAQGVQSQRVAPTETSNISIGANGVRIDSSDRSGNHAHISVGANGVNIQSHNGVRPQRTTASFGVGSIEKSRPNSSDGQTILITGTSLDRVIDGEGKHVVVSGASNDVNIKGHCLSLVVSGASNDIIVERANKIVSSGANNDVLYRGGRPAIVNSGINSSVERG